MAISYPSWDEAILKTLGDAEGPLHYREIANRILKSGLRPDTPTPSATVSSRLSVSLVPSGKVVKSDIGSGHYGLSTSPNTQASNEDIAAAKEDASLTRVVAYGLYWDRDKVNWESPRRLLGRVDASNIEIDFARQSGIYILYHRLAVMYVGRTVKNDLWGRLKDHTTGSRRAARWEQFSWFGFREVSEDGTLSDNTEILSTSMLLTILESVMIEALIPPLNDKGGDLMGEMYQQVEDPVLVQRRDVEFRRMVAKAIQPD